MSRLTGLGRSCMAVCVWACLCVCASFAPAACGAAAAVVPLKFLINTRPSNSVISRHFYVHTPLLAKRPNYYLPTYQTRHVPTHTCLLEIYICTYIYVYAYVPIGFHLHTPVVSLFRLTLPTNIFANFIPFVQIEN